MAFSSTFKPSPETRLEGTELVHVVNTYHLGMQHSVYLGLMEFPSSVSSHIAFFDYCEDGDPRVNGIFGLASRVYTCRLEKRKT